MSVEKGARAQAAREQLDALARGDWEAADAAGSRILAPTATPCEHEWTERGSGALAWRECWLCGEQTPYGTRPTPPGLPQ